MATYQMPLVIGQNLSVYFNLDSYSAVTYDLQSGYALQDYNMRTHALYIPNSGYFTYFLMDIKNTTNEILSTFEHNTVVDKEAYISATYPVNGTVWYKNGTKTVYSTE